MTKTELAKLSDTDLKVLANELGVGITPDTSRRDMISAIAAATPHGSEPSAEEIVQSTGPKVRILIHSQEGVDNTPFVKVGVNGVAYSIPRDIPVVVPAVVYEVLKNAIYTFFNENGQEPKNTPRFPIQFLGSA